MNRSEFLETLFGHRTNLTNFTSPYTNATHRVLVAKWTIMPTFSLITCIFGFIGNGTLLCLFIKDQTLRTPFNIYLINLLTANLIGVIIQNPMDIVSKVYGFSWFMGSQVCTLYLYARWVIQAIAINAHMLITINRIWAVARPISYRSYHSVRIATLLCVGSWVYTHVTVVPGWAADASFYRSPVEKQGCFLNMDAQPAWAFFVNLIVFDLPKAVMIVAFPLICITKFLRRKILPASNTIPMASSTQQSTFATTNSTKVRLEEMQSEAPEKKGRRKRRRAKSHGNLVLALLTISVTICWTPGAVYYTMVMFMPQLDSPTVIRAAAIMASCQTMLDPVLFTLALPSLRKSLHSVFYARI